MRLDRALEREGRCAFVPFITAGDPSLSQTAARVKALSAAGADVIELGVPFSDPVADGPVIQAAAARALRKNTTLRKVLLLVAELRREGLSTPIVLFTYLNPVLRLGVERFADACGESGVDGVLAVDLSAEESSPLSRELSRRGVELVLLVSPTTTDDRIRLIGKSSGSIVYYVSREGVTGARAGVAGGLAARISRVRRLVKKPVIVGFGVSEPAQARALARVSDGVVVGSALVAAGRGGTAAMARLARRLVSALGR